MTYTCAVESLHIRCDSRVSNTTNSNLIRVVANMTAAMSNDVLELKEWRRKQVHALSLHQLALQQMGTLLLALKWQ